MIQLSDYDYPILINPHHFHHSFKSISDLAYIESMKVSSFLQDIIKSIIIYDKSEQTGLLMKKYPYSNIALALLSKAKTSTSNNSP